VVEGISFRLLTVTTDILPLLPTPAELAPIGPVVRRFFHLLDEAGVAWAILRGSDGLPEQTRYDIDLLIDPGAMDRGEALLAQAAAAEGWAMVRIIEKLQYRCCLAASPGSTPRFLPIDFFGRCLHRFYPIADEQYALRHRQRNDAGVWVVPAGFGAALALVKELMRHDTFKANSREEVMRGAIGDADGFRQAVLPFLGESLAKQLLESSQAGVWEQVERLAPDLRSAVLSQRLRCLPAATAFFAKNLLHNLHPPMSAFVVLLGPDGSGKSTIGDLVAERLYQRPFKICRRFEYNFRLLPELKHLKASLARLVGRKAAIQPPPPPGTKGSGMNRDHPPLRAMTYIFYYSLDLIVGRLLLRRLRGQGSLVLFARYFHDYYYQRGYGRAPRWFLRLIERAVPAPDLILYLDRSAEEIYAGKPELDVNEIKRQQTVIRSLTDHRANAMVVDASGGVEATVQRVCGIITGKLFDQWGIERTAR
jgi:thymidylate kinase